MTASRPIITVVIPVYNAGKYLTRCLDSLLSQSFQDFEVRCVDDASTDDSYEILMGYVAKDPRIKVTRLPENQGVGHARNVGMDLSEGEFIYFLDSDDWLDFDYLESMYRHALSSGLDIVINHNWVFEGKSRSKSSSAVLLPEGMAPSSVSMGRRISCSPSSGVEKYPPFSFV